ncbi:hypothetical protein BCR42DRAFT_376560 [Absidia repens]|uniref:Ribosome biogenesis protein NSA1 n=1 Tax=Absidia repens TaxID=90262 RepID=A0A1X2IF67_9FUNG|nr:hypothetical protein BCR42DRAFT_376560 [Absidia repens]
MRYFTGDENGLIKRVVFLPPIVEKQTKKRSRQEDSESEGKSKKKQEEEPLHEVTVFGKVDKQNAVQKMTWATINNERLLVVARQNGVVDCIHPDSGDVVKSFCDKEISQALADKPKNNRLRFIGLETTETHLMTCNSNGTLTWTPLGATELNVITKLDKTSTTGGSANAGAGTDLDIVRAHPVHRHLIAVGGKDIDLQIYDINAFLGGSSTDDQKNKPAANAASGKKTTDTNKPHPRQKQKQTKLGLIYEAKNVKNDYLDLSQPVWINDLQFMNEEGTQVAVATHYHQIRLYDFKKARRPVMTADVGKMPLTSLSLGMDFDHVVFTDTMNDVGLMNIRLGKVVTQLKGFAGACKATQTIPQPTFGAASSESNEQSDAGHTLVSVGLDRTLRLHELNTKFRKLEKKVYLKQRLTAVLVDTDYVVPAREPNEEEKEEEEIWSALDTVKNKKKSRLA